MDYAKLLEKWRGSGKIKAIKKERLESGKYRLHYYDGRKKEFLDFDGLDYCDQFLLEFGGKNEETVAADPIFLRLFPTFVEELLQRGHNLKRVSLRGSGPGYKQSAKIEIPTGCGEPFLAHKEKKKIDGTEIVKKDTLFSVETASLYRQFPDVEQADNFISWLLFDQEFEDYKWVIKEMITYSRETKQYCRWLRRKAGDATQAMELQLRDLDKKSYQDCLVSELMIAAGDMVWWGSSKNMDLCRSLGTREN